MGKDGKKAETGIFAIDPATSVCVKALDYPDGPAPSLSPDGRTFAVSRAGWTGPDRAIDNQGVWTMAADGKGEMRRIADFGGKVTWSPDSKQLIVARGLSKPSGRRHAVRELAVQRSTARAPRSCRSPRPRRSTTGRPTADGS